MLNYDRSTVKAPIIKKKYNTDEVYDALELLFKNKCFLCEQKRNSARNFDIDHFIPHKKDDKLKFDWNNLFLCCRDCNQYKGTLENILNPCDPNEDVEKLIEYYIVPVDDIPHFYPSDPSNIKIVNTCNLLEKIHNGDNPNSVNKTASLRNVIKRRVDELKIAILNYHRYGKERKPKEEYKALQKIKEICSRKSSYTMLMRSEALTHGIDPTEIND